VRAPTLPPEGSTLTLLFVKPITMDERRSLLAKALA
jgi:hypothetical protein